MFINNISARNYFILTFICIFCPILPLTCGENDRLVDEYVRYINNKTQSALDYKLPTDARMHEAANTTLQEYGEFDFIVIGGGTAGCAVANRLSEIPEWKVLLLEAGNYKDGDLTGIPALFLADMFTKFNWGFYSVPQKYACQGFPNKKCFVPRGKGLGGSSLINGLVYSRGNKIDYDRWADLVNDSSWNYENVLPYFIKSENFNRENFDVPLDEAYHGFNGSISVSQASPTQKISSNVVKAIHELGYNVTDYNGKQQEGGSILQFNSKNGRRFDAAWGYVTPIKNRHNLVVLDRSYVTKIDINNQTKTTRGVIFTRNNKTYYAKARKEVILSGGSISSPQILMLSGIGPEKHLKSLGIPVVQNLPVGILKEHTYSAVILSLNVSDSESLNKSVADYLEGKGFLSRGFTYDSVGFLTTKLKYEGQYSPNLEIFFFNISNKPLVQRYMSYTDEVYNAINVKVPGHFTVYLAPLQPKSVGSVTLKSADPFEYPLIDPNLLSADEDIEILYQSVQTLLELIQTEAFRSMNASLAFDRFPGCEHTESLSKEYWYCYFRQVTTTGVHPTGTCGIGRDPATAVVDNKLKVFGIRGLRVADGSVIPFHINGHTNAACTMVGERASDIIKEEYKR